MSMKTLSVLAGLALAWMSGTAAFGAAGDADLRAELEALKAEVAQLRASNDQTWLNEAQAEQVKSLIHDVLNDAETRASLSGDGFFAGHDGKNFFLKSKDGAFEAEFGGQIQLRYIINSRDGESDVEPPSEDAKEDDDGTGDDFEGGFQLRRSKFYMEATIYEDWTAKIQFAGSRGSGDVGLDEVVIEWAFADNWTLVFGGVAKAPFLREELTSSKRQLAVERSLVNEVFTTDKVQGIGVVYKGDNFKVAAMINDGKASESEDFQNDDTNFAITARAEFFFALEDGAKYKQFKDFTSWGEAWGVLIGGGIHFEDKESVSDADMGSYFMWTVDAGIEGHYANIFVAFMGVHEMEEGSAPEGDGYGLVIQGGYQIIPGTFELFARYEILFTDEGFSDSGSVFDEYKWLAGSDDLDIITFGFNYYIQKHKIKVTGDFMYFLEASPRSKDSLGILKDNSGDDGQIVVRLQLQVTF